MRKGEIVARHGYDERDGREYGFLAYRDDEDEKYYSISGGHSIGNVSWRETFEIASYSYTNEDEYNEALRKATEDLDRIMHPEDSIFSVEFFGNTATITGLNSTDPYIEVPDFIKGRSVTCIGKRAFAGNETLAEVILPMGLRRIEAEAFSGCPLLKLVEIPISVKSFGKGAFSDCPNLRTIITG